MTSASRHFAAHLSIALLLVGGVPTSAQKDRKKVKSLPKTVRQMMPRGASSLRLFRLAPAPHATTYLVHLWTTPRRAISPQWENGYRLAVPIDSPFVLDVFTDEKKPKYQTSIIYAENRAPDKITLRYLDAKNKVGFIFEFKDQRFTSDSYFNSTSTYFIVPVALGNTYSMFALQSTAGSGNYNLYNLRRAANGIIEIIHRAEGSPPSEEILVWDGRRHLFIPKKQKPRSGVSSTKKQEHRV